MQEHFERLKDSNDVSEHGIDGDIIKLDNQEAIRNGEKVCK